MLVGYTQDDLVSKMLVDHKHHSLCVKDFPLDKCFETHILIVIYSHAPVPDNHLSTGIYGP